MISRSLFNEHTELGLQWLKTGSSAYKGKQTDNRLCAFTALSTCKQATCCYGWLVHFHLLGFMHSLQISISEVKTDSETLAVPVSPYSQT